MQNKDISEALYALPDVKIIRRRKPLTIPIVLSLAGLVLFAINTFVNASAGAANIKTALVFTAVSLVLVGGIITLIRICGGDDIPYHAGDKCYLQRKDLRFEKEKRNLIANLIEKADYSTLLSLKEDGVSAVTVTTYSSPKSGFFACQAFEYIELERRPLSKLTYKSM